MAGGSLPPPQPVAVIERPAVGLAMESASVPDFVRALARATGHPRFILAPEVVTNGRRLTVNLSGDEAATWRDGLAALETAGVVARCDRAGLCRFLPAPDPEPPPAKEVPIAVFSYRPRHRDVGFLANSIGSMFQGWHFAGSTSSASSQGSGAVAAAVSPASGSGGSAPNGHASPIESVPDQVVAVGPAPERRRVQQVLEELDKPVVPVVVRLAVFEVDVTEQSQSAVGLLLQSAKVVAGLGAQVTTSAASSGLASLSIKTGDFQAVVSALDTSSHAHLVTAPVLRTSSGVIASFAVGESVPTLGSVSYPTNSGTSVQSVQYQQAGVVFSVIPQVVGDHVDVAIYQSVSQFIPTTTGVNQSPTLQNRVLSSDVNLEPGSVVFLGGLSQNNETNNGSGWWVLPNFVRGHQVSKTDLVLMMQVEVGR